VHRSNFHGRVPVAFQQLSPIPAGIVYCSVIEACQEILDVRRAQEWTNALSDCVQPNPIWSPTVVAA
jgi:hypothetical protein